MAANPAKITKPDTLLTLLNSTVQLEGSDFIDRRRFRTNVIQAVNPNHIPLKVMVSVDATNWIQFGANITDNAWVVLDGLFPYIQVVRADAGGVAGAAGASVTVFLASNENPQ